MLRTDSFKARAFETRAFKARTFETRTFKSSSFKTDKRKVNRINAHYDVVILGGGPAGLAAAIAIRTANLNKHTNVSVLVVERQSPGQERLGENCPPEIVLLLKQLGVAKEFYQDNHEPCPGYASVWGRPTPGYNDFIVNPLGPSWRLNRIAFDKMLAKRAEDCGAQITWSTRFIGTDIVPQTASHHAHTLHLTQGTDRHPQTVTAGFVIDATGSKARFARTLNIQKTVDDQLFATVRFAHVASGKGSKQIQLEATQQGWCYQALLPEQKVVSMIVSEREIIPHLREGNHQGFEEALATTTFVGPSVNKLEITNPSYHSCAIYSGILPTLEGSNWMAVGDAATSFDPISAQGIYKGLSHGLLAAKKVKDWLENNSSECSDYSQMLQKQYRVYQNNRIHMYSLEQRWRECDFWRKRIHTPPMNLAL
ncbi:NAD(P)/FAD-dependent oxidoreductase [Litoribrevibacter albus]|uniref:FAD-binding domain-containing protein n=1 Tax=Litoribrevibacter albus TaxID=1473156 RepID=A0AA37W558_9GAMM|nr:tryptophan 7-halogenase [Litoribrevibacter albus]GLQ30867.1 hypothetical protein GCM10007876_13460 [Litoribrevibacter albus]